MITGIFIYLFSIFQMEFLLWKEFSTVIYVGRKLKPYEKSFFPFPHENKNYFCNN